MAAGVHGAVDPGRVVDAGLLLDRQAVHVARAAAPPGGARGGSGAAAAQYRGDRRRVLAEGDLVGQPVQRLEHLLLGAGQRQADLRLLVQPVAEPGKVRLHFPGICGDRHVFSLVVEIAGLTFGLVHVR